MVPLLIEGKVLDLTRTVYSPTPVVPLLIETKSFELIHACTADGAKDSGDARQVLDLLLESDDIARERNADRVTEDHVQEAHSRLQTDQVVQGITNYPTTRKTGPVSVNCARRARSDSCPNA